MSKVIIKIDVVFICPALVKLSLTLQNHGITIRHYDIPDCHYTEPDTMEYWNCNLSNRAGSFYHSVKVGPSGGLTIVIDLHL
ncbi:hypothetical protein V1477_003521 [Vespula maculifrons]|uniref:Uncharacterized protein n=1 Tax=Vespula maculifrons TaxID=7453 RepID=A0ABD2CT07_VESMC